jgi:hypothetical protein
VIRVVSLEGAELTASTAPSDTAPAPRRLTLDEKPVFDLAQSLRAAVAGNREGAEGAARAEEIAVERQRGGVLSVAAPIERDGVVVGMVQMEMRPAAAKGGFPWLVTLLAMIGPALVFLLLSRVAGERRWALALVGAVLVIAALALFGRTALGTLSAERLVTEEAVAARVAEEGAKTGLSPRAWDVDRFRQPQPAATVAGERDLRRMTRSVLTLSVFARGGPGAPWSTTTWLTPT